MNPQAIAHKHEISQIFQLLWNVAGAGVKQCAALEAAAAHVPASALRECLLHSAG